jgi:hypothetical protein
MKSSEPKANDRDSSLREYCFCVDYQYINSQSETFIYNIQNLLELNESFIEREPNFIASIDLSTGFFQMKMSNEFHIFPKKFCQRLTYYTIVRYALLKPIEHSQRAFNIAWGRITYQYLNAARGRSNAVFSSMMSQNDD